MFEAPLIIRNVKYPVYSFSYEVRRLDEKTFVVSELGYQPIPACHKTVLHQNTTTNCKLFAQAVYCDLWDRFKERRPSSGHFVHGH